MGKKKVMPEKITQLLPIGEDCWVYTLDQTGKIIVYKVSDSDEYGDDITQEEREEAERQLAEPFSEEFLELIEDLKYAKGKKW